MGQISRNEARTRPTSYDKIKSGDGARQQLLLFMYQSNDDMCTDDKLDCLFLIM